MPGKNISIKNNKSENGTIGFKGYKITAPHKGNWAPELFKSVAEEKNCSHNTPQAANEVAPGIQNNNLYMEIVTSADKLIKLNH